MRNPRQVAVMGVTGYTGLELARILLRHPELPPPAFYVREPNGAKCLAELFPQFRAWGEAPLRPLSVDGIASSNAGTAFLATPHEVSAELAPDLLQAGLRVVDLSGAFRFRDAETFTSWYKLPTPHAKWLTEAVYGIPELYSSEISQARLVANPGCYATSVILALRPLTQAGLLAADSGVVCDCKSGASGAGKDPRRDLHFVEVDENFKAYGLFTHRHTPEILEHTRSEEHTSELQSRLHLVCRLLLEKKTVRPTTSGRGGFPTGSGWFSPATWQSTCIVSMWNLRRRASHARLVRNESIRHLVSPPRSH